MKKKILLLSLLIPILSLSKDYRLLLKSEIKNEGRIINLQSFKNTKLYYTPIDLTISNKDRSLKANIVIKGDRANLYQPTTTSRYTTNIKEDKIIIPKNYFYEDIISDKRITAYNIVESSMFKDKNQIGHSHDHDHDHSGHSHHGHNHDHSGLGISDEHQHEHSNLIGDTLDILKPQKVLSIKENNDLQIKASIQYDKNKYGIKYTKYLTSFKEDETRFFKNDAILEGKLIGVYNDKISIGVLPRFILREFRPLVIEMNSYYRYKHDENTTIGIDLYNGVQPNILNERKNYRNKIKFFLDYNTEKIRAHKFWEIVDHEHEKIDQTRLEFSYDRKFNEKLSPVDKKIVDNKKVDEIFNFKAIIKKSDFLTKNFNISNDFDFNYEKTTTLDSDRKYQMEHEFHFKNSDDQDSIIGVNDKGELAYIAEKAYEKVLGTELIKKDYGFDLISHLSQVINPNEPNSRTTDYYIITKIMTTKNTKYTKTLGLKYNLNNNSKLNYKYKDHNFELINNLKYSKLPNAKESKLEDNIDIFYSYDTNLGIKLKFGLGDEYTIYKTNKIVKYQTNRIKTNIDTNYTYNKNKYKLSFGLKLDYNILARKAIKEQLYGPSINGILLEALKKDYPNSPFLTQEKEENNKWKWGQEIIISPYAEFNYDIKRNLILNFKAKAEKKYEQSPFTKAYGLFNPADKDFTARPFEYSIKLGLTYRN